LGLGPARGSRRTGEPVMVRSLPVLESVTSTLWSDGRIIR